MAYQGGDQYYASQGNAAPYTQPGQHGCMGGYAAPNGNYQPMQPGGGCQMQMFAQGGFQNGGFQHGGCSPQQMQGGNGSQGGYGTGAGMSGGQDSGAYMPPHARQGAYVAPHARPSGGGGGGKGDATGAGGDPRGEGNSYIRDFMNEYEAAASNWGNAMPALTGKEIGGSETDLTEAKVWGKGEIAQPYTTFNSCSFPKQIMASIHALGFAAPTPIQAYCWPVSQSGRDLIGIAKTGSGKTLAFLLPPFTTFLGSRPDYNGPQMLIMAPTRELACQIQAEAEKFGRRIGVLSVCVYGGAPRGPQLRDMRQGRHVIVGTPGRLNDYLEGGQLRLGVCKYLVLDEADRMLDMGFEPQIRTIINAIPPGRQTAMFSATWPKEVRKLSADYLRDPVHIQIGSHDNSANKDIQQQAIIVSGQREKQEHVRSILQTLGPEDRCLIFVNTKKMCEELGHDLWRDRIRCGTIHGDKEQRERDQALNAFKAGRSTVLAATDVAARGLDIKGVKMVINFDVANNAEDHVHRIGRTGRAGIPGVAVTFLDRSEGKQAYEVMQSMIKVGQEIPPQLRELAQRGGGGRDWGRKGGSRYGKGGAKGGGWGGNRGGKGGG
ncbi:unnamed protein product, partial [Prorocentrum cordatum]